MFISNPSCQNSGTTAETLSRGFLPKYLSEIDMGKLAGGCDSTATKQKWRPLVDIPNNSETNWIFLMFILIVYPGRKDCLRTRILMTSSKIYRPIFCRKIPFDRCYVQRLSLKKITLFLAGKMD